MEEKAPYDTRKVPEGTVDIRIKMFQKKLEKHLKDYEQRQKKSQEFWGK